MSARVNEGMQPTVRPIQTDAKDLIEPGEAFRRITKLDASRENRTEPRERFDVIVIGAGQAGLSVGYYLRQRGLRFVILDSNERIGDQWRRRWDSLRLFTPASLDGLAGMPFPASAGTFPTKDEMADYLEAYAAKFELPVRCGVRVDRLWREDGRYRLDAGELELEADQVVVAMTNYQKPRVPDFAAELRPDIVQLHSSEYQRPSQLGKGGVLLVGAGNSGAEIALDLPSDRRAWISGRHPGHPPFRIQTWFGRLCATLLLRVFFHRILTIKTPMGRKARPRLISKGGPLIRCRPEDFAKRGIEQLPRTIGARDGLPLLEDGRVVDAGTIVWCTGFHPGFSWIDLPIFDETGDPRHDGGRVAEAPGLYFVGLHFLYSFSSPMIHGVGRDAKRIVAMLSAQASTRRAA